jgi:hypothetical protein
MIKNKASLVCVKCDRLYMDVNLKECPECKGPLGRREIQVVTKEGKKDEKDDIRRAPFGFRTDK